MDGRQPPLNWEASANSSNPQVSQSLPPEVVTCLKNARFLHLATCDDQTPHVSLMNYTYLPSTPFSSSPIIVMTTNPASKKTINLTKNPRVSLLVHDWVSHRPPTRTRDPERGGSPPPQARHSSLASLLLNLNTSAMSSISATINGTARIVQEGSEEEKWCKQQHLDNNTFGEEGRDESGLFGGQQNSDESDGGRNCFIEGEEVRVVVVKIKDGRIADWKGGVKDWILESSSDRAADGGLPNGI